MLESFLIFHQHITDYVASHLAIQTTYLEGAAAYKLGISAPSFNWVYVQDPKWNLQDTLDQSQAFFDVDGLGFCVIVPTSMGGDEMTPFFKERGFERTESTTTMVCDLSKDLPAQRALSAREEVKLMNADLSPWIRPLIPAFQTTEADAAAYSRMHAYALEKGANMQHYTLLVQDLPISSLTLSIHEGLARITDVGTLPDYQGQGLATKLMRYALEVAKSQGVDYCFLEASSSSSSLKLYQNMGFEEMEESRIFERQYTGDGAPPKA